MYVPLQTIRFQESNSLTEQYKHFKSCSRRFYSPESDPPHKIMRYDIYYSTQLSCWFPPHTNLSGGNDLYWRCTSFENAFRRGRPLNFLHESKNICKIFNKFFTWVMGAGGWIHMDSVIAHQYVYNYMHMHMYSYEYTPVHVYFCISLNVCIYTCVCVHRQIYWHIYIRT